VVAIENSLARSLIALFGPAQLVLDRPARVGVATADDKHPKAVGHGLDRGSQWPR